MSSVPVSRSGSRIERGESVDVVGLIGDPVATDISASQALVDDHVALGRAVVKPDRRHRTAARVNAVAGLDVDVQ